MRIVDLSVPTGPGPGEPLPPTIDYEDHERSAPLLAQIFGCEPSDLPDGQGWASETVTLITHAGTHVDAPWHYFPTSGGERARTIDELPLDWFLRPGVRLDVRETPWGERIEVPALEAALAAAGHTLAPFDIVLLWTGAERAWDTAEYFNAGSGLTRASTTWLLEQGVKVIGTDAWGLDRPLMALRAEFEQTGDASILWEAHRAGIDREYCQIEKLHNLGALPRRDRLHRLLPARQGRRRLRRLVPRRRDPRVTPDPDRFAALLCGYCLDVQPGQQVLVRSTTLAAPLLLALQREILEREAWPALRTALPGQGEGYWAAARDVHLDSLSPGEQAETETADCLLTIQAPENTSELAAVDPARLARAARARAPVRELAMQRRWCGTLWPTAAGAQQAGMATSAFAALVERALFLDRDDPVAAWGELRAHQARLIDRLAGASELRIEAEGTDLRLSVAGRTWVNSDGRRNMPSGEVFTGPVEDSAEGRIRFTIPSSPRGVAVEGIELEFRAGQVVEARAGRGEAYLRETLATDAGATRLGEIGIGTNFGIDRPVGAILFDEKIGGTVHLAVGRSYPETGGTNESAVHWDMICDLRDGGRLSADGVTVLSDGRFVDE